MKFEKIKVGDIVYINVRVKTEWNKSTRFWLPKKVEKVTPTLFIVAGDRYRKKNGRCIGGGYLDTAKRLGEEIETGGVVEDQTGKKNELVRKLNLAGEITSIIDQFRVNHKHPKLKEIHSKLKEAESLLVCLTISLTCRGNDAAS